MKQQKSTVEWLDRRVGPYGPYLTLCLSEVEYLAAIEHIEIKNPNLWVTPGKNATVHHASNPKGETVCIVCIDQSHDRNAIEVAGLLIHEAVHIWQQHCDDIGESDPGREQEAYAIQAISQELLAEFARRMETRT